MIVNKNIENIKFNIRNKTNINHEDSKSYLDLEGIQNIKNRYNLDEPYVIEKYSADDTNDYLYNTINNYSNETPTISGEYGKNYNPSTYGNIRLNLQYKGVKAGDVINSFKDYNPNFKRGNILNEKLNPKLMRSDIMKRKNKIQRYTYNNDASYANVTGEVPINNVIKGIRSYDKVLEERLRTVTRNDDDVAGRRSALSNVYKPVNNNSVHSDLVIKETMLNERLRRISNKRYVAEYRSPMQDVTYKRDSVINNRNYKLKETGAVNIDNYISDVQTSKARTSNNKQYNNYVYQTNSNEYTTDHKISIDMTANVKSTNVKNKIANIKDVSSDLSNIREYMQDRQRHVNKLIPKRQEQDDTRNYQMEATNQKNRLNHNIIRFSNKHSENDINMIDSKVIGNKAINSNNINNLYKEQEFMNYRDYTAMYGNKQLNYTKNNNVQRMSNNSIPDSVNMEKQSKNPKTNMYTIDSLKNKYNYISEIKDKTNKTNDMFINKHSRSYSKNKFISDSSHPNLTMNEIINKR